MVLWGSAREHTLMVYHRKLTSRDYSEPLGYLKASFFDCWRKLQHPVKTHRIGENITCPLSDSGVKPRSFWPSGIHQSTAPPKLVRLSGEIMATSVSLLSKCIFYELLSKTFICNSFSSWCKMFWRLHDTVYLYSTCSWSVYSCSWLDAACVRADVVHSCLDVWRSLCPLCGVPVCASVMRFTHDSSVYPLNCVSNHSLSATPGSARDDRSSRGRTSERGDECDKPAD